MGRGVQCWCGARLRCGRRARGRVAGAGRGRVPARPCRRSRPPRPRSSGASSSAARRARARARAPVPPAPRGLLRRAPTGCGSRRGSPPTPSPCAEYLVSVPPLAADKTRLRADQAWRIRALGPSFHALAEINVDRLDDVGVDDGNGWHAAGVEARRRMAAAGLRRRRRRHLGAERAHLGRAPGRRHRAREHARLPHRPLRGRRHAAAAARGVVFIDRASRRGRPSSRSTRRASRTGTRTRPSGPTSRRTTSDWSQELYGDVRTLRRRRRAACRARAASLNEYLQHQTRARRLGARRRPTRPRAFLAATSSPLANAAWQYDAGLRVDERPGRRDAGLRLGADVRAPLGRQRPLRLRVGAEEPRRDAGRRLRRADRRAARPRSPPRSPTPRARPRRRAPAAGAAEPRRRRVHDALALVRDVEARRRSPSRRRRRRSPPARPRRRSTIELRTSTGVPYATGLPRRRRAHARPRRRARSRRARPARGRRRSPSRSRPAASTTSVYFTRHAAGSADDRRERRRQDRRGADARP